MIVACKAYELSTALAMFRVEHGLSITSTLKEIAVKVNTAAARRCSSLNPHGAPHPINDCLGGDI